MAEFNPQAVSESCCSSQPTSAGQGAIHMPTLNELAGPPALSKAQAMFSLTLKVKVSYKKLRSFLFALLMLIVI
jgi:hypothetical protein